MTRGGDPEGGTQRAGYNSQHGVPYVRSDHARIAVAPPNQTILLFLHFVEGLMVEWIEDGRGMDGWAWRGYDLVS